MSSEMRNSALIIEKKNKSTNCPFYFKTRFYINIVPCLYY